MLVKIKQKHFRLATSFDFPNCPLKFALQDLFPKSKILIGSWTAHVGDKKYYIENKWGDHFGISVEEINQNIKLAKQKKKAKSYVIKLT